MKKLQVISLFLSVGLLSCSKLDIEKGTPVGVKKQIKAFNKNAICKDAKVDEYRFQNKSVYAFEQGNCGADLTTDIYNKDGEKMGALGGIMGNTKINGKEFSNAPFVKNVWKKQK